jgi:hypothetical protein
MPKILIKIEKVKNFKNRYNIAATRDPMHLLEIPASANVIILEYDIINNVFIKIRENEELQVEITRYIRSNSSSNKILDEEFEWIGVKLFDYIQSGFEYASD